MKSEEVISKIRTLSCTDFWVQGPDLNRRPPGYEPDELPNCSTLRYLIKLWCRKPGSNRYGKLIPQDFKSWASASSATPAHRCHQPLYITTNIIICQYKIYYFLNLFRYAIQKCMAYRTFLL